MSRTKIALLCVPVALIGLGVAAHASVRVARDQRQLTELAVAGRAAGESFVETLQGEHVEQQLLTYDRRRAAALALAAARRDRLLGLVIAAGAGLAAAGLSVLSRIAAEVEEDRRHVAGAGRPSGP